MRDQRLDRNPDVIIIGAGASGMIASVKAAERHKTVLVLDKNDAPGRKIIASGNGRCNIMNSGVPRYYGDKEFAGNVLKHSTFEDIRQFFQQYGLMFASENEGRIYPSTFQSASVLSVLKNAMGINGVQLKTNTTVSSVFHNNDVFTVTDTNGNSWQTGRLIVSCGSPAQPKLGGTDNGYDFLRKMGHQIIPAAPSLVPLCTDKKSVSGLSGIRVRGKVSLYDHDQLLHSEEGEILFTEYGISGICVMQCSRFVRGNSCCLTVSFLHGYYESPEAFYRELKRRQEMYREYSPVSLLDGVVVSRIAYAIMKQAGVPMKGEKAGDLPDGLLKAVAESAFRYRIRIEGTRGFDFAQVAAGGADCREFDPCTMESKFVPGLFATGEVLNVDGDCGGFNLMFAFSSGLSAGKSV